MPPKTPPAPTLQSNIEEEIEKIVYGRNMRLTNYIEHDVPFPRKQVERATTQIMTLQWVLSKIKEMQA